VERDKGEGLVVAPWVGERYGVAHPDDPRIMRTLVVGDSPYGEGLAAGQSAPLSPRFTITVVENWLVGVNGGIALFTKITRLLLGRNAERQRV
jgi:hypothetical protein